MTFITRTVSAVAFAATLLASTSAFALPPSKLLARLTVVSSMEFLVTVLCRVNYALAP